MAAKNTQLQGLGALNIHPEEQERTSQPQSALMLRFLILFPHESQAETGGRRVLGMPVAHSSRCYGSTPEQPRSNICSAIKPIHLLCI